MQEVATHGNLILTVKEGDSIIIGDNEIKITVVRDDPFSYALRIAIIANRSIAVNRESVYNKKKAKGVEFKGVSC